MLVGGALLSGLLGSPRPPPPRPPPPPSPEGGHFKKLELLLPLHFYSFAKSLGESPAPLSPPAPPSPSAGGGGAIIVGGMIPRRRGRGQSRACGYSAARCPLRSKARSAISARPSRAFCVSRRFWGCRGFICVRAGIAPRAARCAQRRALLYPPAPRALFACRGGFGVVGALFVCVRV